MTGILGRKVGMTRIIADDGGVIPVSVIECLPNEIVQIKTTEKDGYPALILGFDELKKPTKTRKHRHLSEFKIDGESDKKKGDKVSVAEFAEIKSVKIAGTSKGKGTAGVIKRHNFSRGPETHGSHHHRQPGSSSGAVTGTGRTPKGKKFPGRMGNAKISKRNIPLITVDTEKNLLVVKGPLPGSIGSLVRVEAS
ncbi:MAG: 50S ribosomal protein L3 [Candidatus Peribacteraceae bacterium]|nr:50S ribosomal protein L3 [Candidatus Peribacteraceae bacterium]